MKTAREWAESYFNGQIPLAKIMAAVLMQGRLQGYTEAAEIAGIHTPGVATKDWSDYCRGRNDAARDVIAARDKLKAK